MGKQTSVAMTERDEELFLDFLSDGNDIQLFKTFAMNRAELAVPNFGPYGPPNNMFYIWNKAFPFEPEYARTKISGLPENQQKWFTANIHNGPVIEYCRHSFDTTSVRVGRIYWSKLFSAPRGVDYDLVSFDRWYSKVVRWIRKNGRKTDGANQYTYYLPDALSHAK